MFHNAVTVVTGASAGIGAAFARELASRGSDLVLVARRRDRLEDLAETIRGRHGRRVDVVAADLSEPGAGGRLEAECRARGLRPTSLINNAGFGMHGDLAHADSDRLAAMLRLNVEGLVDITRAFLPGLLEHGRGALVNVASSAGYQPVPGMAAYAASKAFVLSFTEALWRETRRTGVRVLALSPGPTRTEFFDVVATMNDPAGTFQTPEQVVRTALRALARRHAPPSIVSGRLTAAQATAVRFLPRRAGIAIASGFTSAKPAA